MSDTYSPEGRPRRGRPPNAERQAIAAETVAEQPVETARQADTKTRRRRREGIGPERNMKLHVPEEAKDPKFVYRWVNDRQGRVRQLTKQDDYEVVSATELTGGDPETLTGTAEGTVMTRTGDSRNGEHVVLLKKPKDYYEKDKAEEQKAIDARDAVLRKGPADAGQEGLSSKDGAYVPGGRNIIAGR